MNRRNAMLGWATWTVFRQLAKRNAKAKPEPVEVEEGRRFGRRRSEEVEAPKKKRKTWPALALAFGDRGRPRRLDARPGPGARTC